MRLIRDGESGGGRGEGGEGEEKVNSSYALSDPQRPKRPSATARTTKLKKWGPRQCEAACVLRWLIAVLTAVRNSHKDNVLEQLSRNLGC